MALSGESVAVAQSEIGQRVVARAKNRCIEAQVIVEVPTQRAAVTRNGVVRLPVRKQKQPGGLQCSRCDEIFVREHAQCLSGMVDGGERFDSGRQVEVKPGCGCPNPDLEIVESFNFSSKDIGQVVIFGSWPFGPSKAKIDIVSRKKPL